MIATLAVALRKAIMDWIRLRPAEFAKSFAGSLSVGAPIDATQPVLTYTGLGALVHSCRCGVCVRACVR